jgi:hypothetical protein
MGVRGGWLVCEGRVEGLCKGWASGSNLQTTEKEDAADEDFLGGGHF